MTDVLDRLAELKINVAEYEVVERLPSGSLAVDYALGGGWPKGRFSLIYGAENLGKSTLMLLAAARNSQEERSVGYFDIENALSMEWAEKLGVNPDHFYLFQPSVEVDEKHNVVRGYMEQVLDNVLTLLRERVFALIILDSLDALAPRNLLEGDMGDAQIGLKAKLMSEFFRKAAPLLRQSGTVFLAINQIRETIGAMYGPSDVIPGGLAQKFYSSVRVRMLKAQDGVIKSSSGELSGVVHKGRVEKNKTAPPFREFEVTVRQVPFTGPDLIPELFALGKQLNLFQNREGGAYKQGIALYNGVELGNGQRQIETFLHQNPQVSRSLEQAIRSVMEGL